MFFWFFAVTIKFLRLRIILQLKSAPGAEHLKQFANLILFFINLHGTA
jgi:hypothetical protein